LRNIQFEEQPSRLFIPPESRATDDRAYFNDQFGPIWRSEQIIVTSKNPGESVLTIPVLLELLELQQAINEIQVAYSNVAYNLRDLCFDVQENGKKYNKFVALYNRMPCGKSSRVLAKQCYKNTK
jgi:Niemann-Pick C1 protein